MEPRCGKRRHDGGPVHDEVPSYVGLRQTLGHGPATRLRLVQIAHEPIVPVDLFVGVLGVVSGVLV